MLRTSFCICLTVVMSVASAANDSNKPSESTSWPRVCNDWDDWDKPGPAFKLYGNSYYVGTCGIAAILITGAEGHVLIDGTTEAGAKVVANNIRSLGFKLTDIKLLLHSHEHFDHVAGLAELQKLSGAKLVTSKPAEIVLNTGITATNDPQAGMHAPFPAAVVENTVGDGEILKLGDIKLTAIATPGHSPGALSWSWQSCVSSKCLNMVYADSLSPVSSEHYKFTANSAYLAAYQAGLIKLETLECDLLATPHPSASDMHARLLQGSLIDAKACKTYSESVQERLKTRIRKEQGMMSN